MLMPTLRASYGNLTHEDGIEFDISSYWRQVTKYVIKQTNKSDIFSKDKQIKILFIWNVMGNSLYLLEKEILSHSIRCSLWLWLYWDKEPWELCVEFSTLGSFPKVWLLTKGSKLLVFEEDLEDIKS